jgi:hypothetical protein
MAVRGLHQPSSLTMLMPFSMRAATLTFLYYVSMISNGRVGTGVVEWGSGYETADGEHRRRQR